MTRVMLVMFAGIILGIPMVAYLWETLHLILSLQVDGRRLLYSLPVLLLFAGLLSLMGRGLGVRRGSDGNGG